jgi:methionine synthase I (cobalamin-dependent)
MKYLKTFETYTFEDFTHADIEDVKELLEEGLDIEQIAIELDFSLDKVKQIVDSIRKNQQMFNESKIHIPIEYSGVIMELGEEVDPNDIISLYNEIVEEGTPLVSYSEYGTEGKFYNEDDDEIPTDAILDELNYAIGLED